MNPLSDDLTLDHVHPGGNSTEDNLVTACIGCNARKGTRKAEEFRALVLGEARERLGLIFGGTTMGQGVPSPIPLEEILSKASDFTHVDQLAIKSRNNQRRIVDARTVFSVMARNAGYSLPVIGKFLGKHHTTVLHMLDNIAPKIPNCPQSIFNPRPFSEPPTTTDGENEIENNLINQ